MKKFSQQDFDALPIVDGYRQCPTGDYSAVLVFGPGSTFGSHCGFGSGCEFGTGCKFGEGCEFGSHCKFGEGCVFGSGCEFGSGCKFGSYCKFDSCCKFDQYCKFGPDCKLGSYCKFGSYCTFDSCCVFGSGCSVEGGYKLSAPNNAILQIAYAGSSQRLTTAFNVKSGPIVRCGCFLGTLDEFRAAVKKTHGGSKHARVYLGWADLVEIQFGEEL